MKALRFFLLTILLTNFHNLLNSMENDSQQTDDDDIEAADKSNEDDTKIKEKLDIKVDSDEYNLKEKMANLDIKESPQKRSLQLTHKAKKLWRNQKQITAQITKEKIEALNLQGIKPQNIPTYLLEILLDRKSPLKCIDISPKQSRAIDGKTATSALDVITALFGKIAEALKSKVDKELKKIKIAINEDVIKKLTDDEFLKLPIQIDKKDIEKFKEDPNISSIKFGQFTIYIIPEECKSGWNTAQKVITVIGWAAAGLGWAFGIYAGTNPLTNNTCNCTAINDTSISTGMFNY